MSDANLPAKADHRIEIPLTAAPRSEPAKLQAIRAQSFSGPIPPPELLGRYESLCPGSADRIISLAEREAEHRRSIEQAVVASEAQQDVRDSHEARRGQLCAVLITLTAIGAGAYTALQGHELAGSIIGVGGIGSIVTSFLAGRSKHENIETKQPQPKENGNKKPRNRKR